jgi:hypothetical protein
LAKKREVTKALFVWWKVVFKKLLSKLFCICLSLEKLVNEKHFLIKEKFDLVSRKVFFFSRKHFPEVVKNLVFKLLIAIYFVLNFIFSISPF